MTALNIERWPSDAVALTDGSRSMTFGELVDRSYAIGFGLANAGTKRWYLDGITDMDALPYVYGAHLAGVDLLCLPSFIPKIVRKGIGFQHRTYANVRSIEPALSGGMPGGGGRVFVFTSGTTGKPKLVAYGPDTVHWPYEFTQYDLGPGTTVYNPAPMVAAPVAFEMALSGGCTVLIEPDRLDVTKLGHVDGAMAIPSTLDRLLWHGAHLKAILTATGPVSAEQERAIQSGTVPVWDVYTSTETGILGVRNVSDGGPFEVYPEMEVRLDDQDQTGAGVVMARGHHTMAAEFRGGRLHESDEWVGNGDLARLDQRGNLVSVVRGAESKVKVSGYSVYTDTVRHLAERAPGVTHSTLEVHRGLPDDVLVLRTDGHPPAVKEWLQGQLPWYAVPQMIVPV